MNGFSNMIGPVIMTLLVILPGCASENVSSDVLSPIDATSPDATAPLRAPSYEKLMQLCAARGIEGIGLEFEDEAVLDRLLQALSDKRVAAHHLKLLYTGMAMSYDASSASLTVGGVSDTESIVRYILKNVPVK